MKKRLKERRVSMKNLLLRTLVIGGVASVALIAPNMTRLLKHLDRPAKSREQLYRRITQGLSRLEQEGLVVISGKFGKRRVEITTKGKEVMEKVEFREYEIPVPAFWDGKWRVLMFDIKERRRKVRDQLRRLLQGAGFVRMQDSVWIYPYSCDEFISLLRAHLKSGVGEMRYFVADTLESDKGLREHFRL